MDEKDYEKIKAEYEASTDMQLVEWARPYFEGTKKPRSDDRYEICRVTNRAAHDIFLLTGSDVHGFSHVIRSNETPHMKKDHGAHGKADHFLADLNHLGRLSYVLTNYDEIIFDGRHCSIDLRNKKNEPSVGVLYVKRINGYVCCAEAVTDSPKSKVLYIKSMYFAKTSAYFQQIKESVTHGSKTPSNTVKNETDSVTSILPQPDNNVNPLDENSLTDDPTHETPRQAYERIRDARRAAEAQRQPPKITRADYEEALRKIRANPQPRSAKPSGKNNDGKPPRSK